MNKLPKRLATLGGIVGFCTAQLLCLLRDSPPLCSMKRALVCALVLAVLTWLCAHVAVSVFQDGMRRPGEGP
jgi:hypothetical protein